MIRLLAIDLDGTLLRSDHTVSPTNRRAVEAAQAAGIEVVIASARVWHSARRVALQYLPPMNYAALHDGQMIVRPGTGDWLHTTTVPAAEVQRIVRRMDDLAVSIELCRPQTSPDYDYLVALDRGPTQAMQAAWRPPPQPPIHLAPEPTDDELADSFSLRVIAHDFETLDQVEGRLADLTDVVRWYRFTRPDPGFVITQIMPKHVGKWEGIRWVADQESIPVEQIAVIGDEINDVTALRNAGLGVAVGNAIPEAHAAADLCLDLTHDQDAVAAAIDHVLHAGS